MLRSMKNYEPVICLKRMSERSSNNCDVRVKKDIERINKSFVYDYSSYPTIIKW